MSFQKNNLHSSKVGFMKRLVFFFLPILLTSCSSINSIFNPIQTIKCKKIRNNSEFPFQPKESKSGPKVIIFNKNTGELFFYDDFFETLIPMPEETSKWIKSTIVNGKLKINQGSKKVWGKAIINLNDLTGKYLLISPLDYKKFEWELRCVKVKNLSTNIKNKIK